MPGYTIRREGRGNLKGRAEAHANGALAAPKTWRTDLARAFDPSRVWNMKDHEEARSELLRLTRYLMDLNPSAAESLEEGLEETLTLHRLGVPESLRKSPEDDERDRELLLLDAEVRGSWGIRMPVRAPQSSSPASRRAALSTSTPSTT